MKTFKVICIGVITLLFLHSCQSDQKSRTRVSDVIGAYEYTGNLEGNALYDETHFAFTFRTKTNKPDTALTFEERYNSLGSNAGTWTIKDSIVTCTFTFNKDPKLIGTSFRFVYDIKGNEFNYRIIDQEGKITGKGSALKIK